MARTSYKELLAKHPTDLTGLDSSQRVEIDEYPLDLATILYASGAWSFLDTKDDVGSDNDHQS
ncbi:hypothetical protein [Rhizobium leguminosarum]|uniref:hypothetical protein n=1 Tax=Rhizobium leguminosarum TaxID=384 RepID=UPI0011D04222|nr:hypothetical protein [Rhizobium leguminosarum]NKL21825.1 hypothetical protein [Rhizobium leguminosarum bv. viciae]